MTVIMKDDHLRIVKEIKHKALKIHLIGVLLLAVVVFGYWFQGWENAIVKESYKLFKQQHDSLIAKQQLYSILRSKSLTVGQALDLGEVILGQNQVPISIALAMISIESNFNPDAVSNKGAKGLTQVMPILRKAYANHPSFGKEINQVYDVSVNAKLGLTYLGDLHKQYKDWKPALRAYNAGPENAHNKNYDRYSNLVLGEAKKFKIETLD